VFLLVGLALITIWYLIASRNRAVFGAPIWQLLGEILFSLVFGDLFDSLALIGIVSTLIGVFVIIVEWGS
jgi:hypothetical protein